MTPPVTLVVQSVLAGVWSANAHVLKGHLSAPGNDDMVDIDGIVPRPQDPLINPQEPTLKDEGFDKPHHVPDGEAGNPGNALIGNPGVLAKEVCFGKEGI